MGPWIAVFLLPKCAQIAAYNQLNRRFLIFFTTNIICNSKMSIRALHFYIPQHMKLSLVILETFFFYYYFFKGN